MDAAAGQQISEEIGLYQEEFPLMLDDLLALPKTTLVLVESAALLPHLVASLLVARHQALWMVPVPEFQMKHYMQREWAQEIVATCTHPEQAFANWMQRDISFAAYVTQKAIEQGSLLICVDGSHSLELSFRYTKCELALECPRLWSLEARLKLLGMVMLVYAFLLSLLDPVHHELVEALLRFKCHRTGKRCQEVQAPLYRLRWALSRLWDDYRPRLTCFIPPSDDPLAVCSLIRDVERISQNWG